MARKELDLTITDAGRDRGKVFHIRELPASQAERWALRAFQALARAGVDVGQVGAMGIQGLAIAGVNALALLPTHDLEPLLDEMMTCVTIKPDPRNAGLTRLLIEDDIEEVATRLRIRMEVVKLHVDFSEAGAAPT